MRFPALLLFAVQIVGQPHRGVKGTLKTKDFISETLNFSNKPLRFIGFESGQPVAPYALEAL